MYVITFYSFKGGVGRTMALSNIAYELAQTGQRVLVVDFDLEAPGLDTLDFGGDPRPTPGVVDYVTEYKRTGRAPSVLDFIRNLGDIGSGHLWLMPSGIDDGKYAERLSAINWGELYTQRDGYVMFEDMKEQWRESISPDYVLIDSRTGYTDVAGICTRQLPDAVVALFVPNEQNLRGLKRVVDDIRTEADGARGKAIELHFSMSNVPELDDEDEILDRQIKRFRQQLKVRDFFIINRYDSLALLNQTLFTKERPRSRLAKQYRGLADRIRRWNPRDSVGALKFMAELMRRPRTVESRTAEKQLERIRDNHLSNGAVLTALGEVWLQRGRTAEALDAMERADDAGFRSAKLFLQLAEARQRTGRVDALSAAEKVLDQDTDDELLVMRTLVILRQGGSAGLIAISRLAESRALGGLTKHGRLFVADQLNMNRSELRVAEKIYASVQLAHSDSLEFSKAVPNGRVLCAIGLGEFERAISMLRDLRRPSLPLAIDDQFNLSMAMWGRDGVTSPEEFEKVLKLSEGTVDFTGANYHECLAITAWVARDQERAMTHLALSREKITTAAWMEVSCWRYLRVSVGDFKSDLDAIQGLIGGQPVLPLFMTSD